MIDLKSLKQMSQTFKILYVEDDISIQKEMTQYLKKLFLEVHTAENGRDALNLYNNNTFDIVITDLSMPVMSGLEMLKKIKQTNKDQPILITSAHNETKYMIEAIRLGVDGYIIKPFEYEQLNKELFKIVEKLKKYKENEEYKKSLKKMVEQKTSELNDMIRFQKYNYEKTLLSMVKMIEVRDTYTAGHSERVAKYCKKIAKVMGYSSQDCEKIYQAGILHDIGKVATPDVVLLKPGDLNELEYNLIKEHVKVGYNLLIHIPMFKELADIVYAHHERYDGKGYPRGLKGDEIMPLSRIMILSDAFDAMTTNRIYKARKTLDEALKELSRLKAIQFHPEVVDAALVAFKDIEIDNDINQLPHTEIEKERFAYFYKDTLCDVYNQNYLDLILIKNQENQQFNYINIVYLKGFTKYNQNYGWTKGDELLKEVSKRLKKEFPKSYVFRVFGDDFIILSNLKIDKKYIDKSLKPILSNRLIYDFKTKKISTFNKEEIGELING